MKKNILQFSCICVTKNAYSFKLNFNLKNNFYDIKFLEEQINSDLSDLNIFSQVVFEVNNVTEEGTLFFEYGGYEVLSITYLLQTLNIIFYRFNVSVLPLKNIDISLIESFTLINTGLNRNIVYVLGKDNSVLRFNMISQEYLILTAEMFYYFLTQGLKEISYVIEKISKGIYNYFTMKEDYIIKIKKGEINLIFLPDHLYEQEYQNLMGEYLMSFLKFRTYMIDLREQKYKLRIQGLQPSLSTTKESFNLITLHSNLISMNDFGFELNFFLYYEGNVDELILILKSIEDKIYLKFNQCIIIHLLQNEKYSSLYFQYVNTNNFSLEILQEVLKIIYSFLFLEQFLSVSTVQKHCFRLFELGEEKMFLSYFFEEEIYFFYIASEEFYNLVPPLIDLVLNNLYEMPNFIKVIHDDKENILKSVIVNNITEKTYRMGLDTKNYLYYVPFNIFCIMYKSEFEKLVRSELKNNLIISKFLEGLNFVNLERKNV